MGFKGTEKVKTKGKRLFFRVVFSRSMLTILLLLVQIAILISIYLRMNHYLEYFMTAFTLMSVVLIIYIINCDNRPEFKLAWMLPVCMLPIFGVLFYIMVKINPGAYGLKKNIARRRQEAESFLRQDQELVKEIGKESEQLAGLSYYFEHTAHAPIFSNTDVAYYPNGQPYYEAVKQELRKAQEYIFIEYFIIEEGIMWNTILGILKEKVKAGVEVRVLYDGTCSVAALPYGYYKKLEKHGIQCKEYAPIKPMLSTYQNFRDHRKLLIIDGKTGFTGGINLADEYINKRELYGYWKDTGVKLYGDGVRSMTVYFLQMWYAETNRDGEYANYLRTKRFREPLPTDGYVVPYTDDPVNAEDVAEDVYRNILNCARRYVYIMTPYLILDHEMLSAICFASKRGIDVRIILPHIPDKKIPFYIAKTYYQTLTQAGVKIYEYLPGFVHAKVFLSDDKEAIVGSINLDYRSLYHHFETAVFIYKNPVLENIKQDFMDTIDKSLMINNDELKRIPIPQRILGRLFRIFSALL
ncbi:MAG: cardiolipin synthase [Clostridia bacterium]|nr:cardiolipin synthase [Clostridia bacterium]